MVEAVKNEFSELEIIQAPDYLKSYDETANLDAWSDAAAQAKENGQQLLASAQARVRDQNAFFQLAPKLAKAVKDGYDARDKRLMTEQKELQQRLLAAGHELSLKDLNDYYANEENISNQTGFFDQQAQILFDKGQTELANEVRALTGRRAKMMRRVLLMETTDSYEADFIAGRDDVRIEREGEPDLTWNNAETTAERRMIMSRWRQDQGLLNNDIYKFSDEFLEDVYYKKVRQIDTKILNESNAQAVKLEEATHIEDTQRVFAAAGKLNNGLLGQEIDTFVKENSGRYYGEAGARLAARNILLGMVENGLMSSAEFKSLYLHQFKHRGTNKEENYSIFKEFSLNDPILQAKLEAAEGKALNLKTQQIAQKADEYALYWTQKAQELNRPFTELELKQIQQGWDQLNPGQPLPKALTDQVYRTLEDKEDLDVVADIEDKLERGVALTDEYMNIKGDQALKEKYQKITASELGQGLDPRIAKADKKYIKALVKEHFNMTMGTSDTDTPEYLIMLGNAERLYATSYRNAQFHTAGEKSDWARQQVEAAMSRNNGASLKVKPSVSSAQSYALKKATALGHISENGSQVVRKGILPGTEDDFKLLEKWATNPTGSIPPIYNVLSRSINKPGYTGWHLANEQYQAVTGKNLPEPKAIQTLHGKSPMIQNLLTNYPSYNGNRRAAIIDKGNGNFNIEGALLPGYKWSQLMSDSNLQLQDSDINQEALDQVVDTTSQWLEQAQAGEQYQQQIDETQAAENAQAAAAAEDPRNKEDWGIGGVVKELQSAFMGGIQDTGSSLVTLPERAIDMMTGEMQEEMKSDEGYDAEWDDWFVNDANPIETKTWWGGLIRSATHFGTMAAAIIPAASAAGVGATALGAGRAVTWVGGAMANQWVRAAAVGAASDLASKYSQDANALQILRDRYGMIDTPLTTNDMDHPALKTFKNVVEGLGIGELANGVFRIMGKGMKRVLPDGRLLDNSEEGIARGAARSASVDEQTLAKAQVEIAESGTEFRGHKNKPVANAEQGAPTSKDNPVDVRNAQKRVRNELGAEDGSPGSVTDPVQLEIAAKTKGLSEEVIEQTFRDLVSEPRFASEMAAIQAGRTTIKEVWGDAIEAWQRIGLGREAADLSPEEYFKEFFDSPAGRNIGTPDEMLFWSARNVVAADLVVGSLMREIRDLGIVGRELADIADLGSVDGPAKALFDKLLTATTEIRRSELILSDDYAALAARADATPAMKKAALDAQKQFVSTNIQSRVEDSIDAYRLALKVAGESQDDDLFKMIFETVSMNKDINNVKDFDNYLRHKLRGKTFKGKEDIGLIIKGWERVMINSMLSSPKTPMRALIGTSTATFMRPLSTAVGAFSMGDGATLRASLAAMNAMREAIPEAWTLFRRRLDSYWAGDVATIKNRFTEYTKGEDNWAMYGDFIENSGRATDGDKAAYYMANMARGLNDNKFLTYSTKLMASIDDTFGYLLARAKGREKAYREALDLFNQGKVTEITPQVLREGEDRFLKDIIDADGNIRLDTDLGKNVEFARREVTLTQDLNGFAKGLDKVFGETPWAKPFFLFARTGVNGLTLTAKHTPGFNFLVKEYNDIARASLDDLSSVAKYGINNAEDLINAKALQQGRLIVGGSLITMAGIHFMNGGLTGNGPTDRSKRAAWIDAGYVPRSINIGGVWVGYDSFEPFNQIFAAVADIGDHSQLMGEEWTKDNFQKLALVLMQAATSKSYLQGMGDFVDLLSGAPGKQEKILAGLMNNTMPLGGLRNDLGKLFNPYMKELNNGWQDTFRNRNQLFEYGPGQDLAIKYDLLNGRPIRDHDFPTRMWNMFIPVPLNLDQGPGRKLLFDSGYDLRLSTYYGPDGTDLTESPELRSLYQQYIGQENIERQLNKLAKDPKIQASLKMMYHDMRNGHRDEDPMKAYHHNKVIRKIFTKAKQRAWAKMRQNSEVQALIEADRQKQARTNRQLKKSQDFYGVLQMQNK